MKGISRRSAFAAAGAGSLGLAAFIGSASAAEKTATEKANAKIVDDFMKAWRDPKIDVNQLAAYCTDDCVLRLNDKVLATTKAGVIEAFNAFVGKGMRFDIKVLETFAGGPLVVNARMDATVADGKTSAFGAIWGVFLMKDGKIKEWQDYTLPKA